jgi:5-methylcytosine-specific restriction protein A
MPGNRNPDWERDEVILALDLYFKHYPKIPPPPSDSDVVHLSQLLIGLPIHPLDQRSDTFRNPNAVSMKLANFRYIDTRLSGGIHAVSRLDVDVWDEFANDANRLHKIATAIRRNADEPISLDLAELEEQEEEAVEGKILLRVHKSRERNRAIVRRKRNMSWRILAGSSAKSASLTSERSMAPWGRASSNATTLSHCPNWLPGRQRGSVTWHWSVPTAIG